MSNDISVVIPAYNAEKWIEEALDSVLKHQGGLIKECIVVDDGSRDGTPDILSRYALKNDILKVITIPNSGVSVARNVALDVAMGDWVFFVDSDDFVVPGALKKLLRKAREEDCDIIEGDIIHAEDSATLSFDVEIAAAETISDGSVVEMSGREAARRSLYQDGIDSSLYGKLYRRSLWEGIRMPAGEIYEDLSVFYRVAMRAKKYVRFSLPVYIYRIREESQIHEFSVHRLDVLKVTERICNDFRERIKREESGETAEDGISAHSLYKAAHDRRFAANYNILGLLVSNRETTYSDITEKCEQFIRRNSLYILFNRRSRRKNHLGALAVILLPRRILRWLLRRTYS